MRKHHTVVWICGAFRRDNETIFFRHQRKNDFWKTCRPGWFMRFATSGLAYTLRKRSGSLYSEVPNAASDLGFGVHAVAQEIRRRFLFYVVTFITYCFYINIIVFEYYGDSLNTQYLLKTTPPRLAMLVLCSLMSHGVQLTIKIRLL